MLQQQRQSNVTVENQTAIVDVDCGKNEPAEAVTRNADVSNALNVKVKSANWN